MAHSGSGRLGEPTYMHLVDDRLVHRTTDGAIPLPVVILDIDHDTAYRTVQVIPWDTGFASLPEGFIVPLRVEIDQHFVAIKTTTLPRVVGTLHPVGIVHTWLQPFQKNVPEMKGLVEG